MQAKKDVSRSWTHPSEIQSDEATLVVPVSPVAKPRSTRRDKFNPSKAVLKYRGFCDDFNTAAAEHGFALGEAVSIQFYVPTPPSVGARKAEALWGTPHQQRPDLDNFVKAVLDAPKQDDSHIWYLSVSKVWCAPSPDAERRYQGWIVVKNLRPSLALHIATKGLLSGVTDYLKYAINKRTS